MIRRFRITRAALSLALVASFALSGARRAAADEPDYNELQRQFESAYANKDYAKALEASKKLHEQRPDAVAHVYNIACMNCLLGNKNEAYKWLDKLAETDFKDADYLMADADFRTLQGEPRFREIVGKIRGEKPSEKKKPERKIKKLNDEKPKKQDEVLSAGERVQKIQALTQELIRNADKDGKRALATAMEAHEHAIALQDTAKNDPHADPRLKTVAETFYGMTAYNVACMYARLDKKDDAFTYLDKAIEHKSFDPNLANQIQNDGDLDSLRSDARYAKAMKRLGVEIKALDPRLSDDNLPEVEKMTPEAHGQAVHRIANEIVGMGPDASIDDKLELARKALAHAKALMKLNDKHPEILKVWSLANYNVACMYSLKDDSDAAVFYLNRAVEAGGWGRPLAPSIEGDSDFDNIRKTDGYKAALERAKRGNEAADSDEQTVDPAWKITLPRNYDAAKKTPLIVALHHYNGNMENTTDRWRKAADDVGAILLTPQGTVKMGDNVYSWGRDIDTIERNVMKAIDKVMDEHKVDQKKIVLGGFSQGGWATWAIAARNPDTFRGIIPVCGAVRPEIEKELESSDIGNLRAWIMLGEDENSAVIDSNEAAAKQLKKAGAKIKIELYEGVGHGYPENSDEELTKALHFILD